MIPPPEKGTYYAHPLPPPIVRLLLTPEGKEESHHLETRGVPIAFSFSGGTLGMGCSLFVLRIFVCVFLYVCFASYYEVITFQRAVKYERRHGSSR